MSVHPKPYKGMAMEGCIATWYAKNTSRDRRRFVTAARAVAERLPSGGRVLELAPGPGYLAIEIAKSGPYQVTGLDISRSFVRMARQNAEQAGIAVDFQQGNAAAMPFADASFDYVVCMAAFKNFTNPIGALNEIYRVLKPGGEAAIYDLRREASVDEIRTEVRDMNLSALNSVITRWIFQFGLLKRAYSLEALKRIAAQSRFRSREIERKGIGFELRLHKS
jgi:ubiquinone/menaquinone biosynthesis C-methylase UbiE